MLKKTCLLFAKFGSCLQNVGYDPSGLISATHMVMAQKWYRTAFELSPFPT